MRATINRITAILSLIALFQLNLPAQIFDTGIHFSKSIPPGHKKAVSNQTFSAPATSETMIPGVTTPATFPICAFDELNEQHCKEDPAFEKELKKYLEEAIPALALGEGKSVPGPLLTISVVVHIIHNGEPVGQGPNLSDAHVQAQIAILNEDFSALNPQFYNTPAQWSGIAGMPNIQFCLASVDPNGNPTNGITRHNLQVTGSSWNNNNINSSIKPATKWDPNRYFNIYVLAIPGTTAAGGVVGFSNYPTPSLIGSDQDGVVIDYRWFGAPGFPTSGWRPLTHETGHYLGLPHPFNGNSCSQDDGIADTPNIEKSTRELATLDCANGYPAGPVSCGNQHLYVNYMDYVMENCYTSFTVQQVNVMRAVLNGTSQGFGYGSRNSLLVNAPAQCVIPANDAGVIHIVSPPQTTCTPSTLQPVVTLRNFGSANLTSVQLVSKVNNNAVDTFLWQGSMFPGENLDVTLPAYQTPNGNYTLSFYTLQPNGTQDENISNDTITGGFYTYLAISPPMMENFEDETSLPTNTGIFSFNVSGDDFEWELTSEVSAWGQGSKSVVFDNFAGDFSNNPFGTIDALITRHYDFSQINGATLKFDVAYAPFDDFLADTLMVLIATNCTQNFNQLVFKKGGFQLATAPASDSLFTPTPTQWRTETIDLSAYDGMEDVTIALVNVSRWGNRMFLDNIRLGVACNALTYTWDIIPNSCTVPPNGPCDGSATIAVANHNGGLSYQWQGWPPNHNLPTVYQLCPGTATVTVTDAFGCTLTATATIGQAPSPTLTVTTTQETSYGANDGSATVTVANGIAPYNYMWSTGAQQNGSNQNSSTISGLAPGNYQVTVEDGNGCLNTVQIQVTSVCSSFLANISVGNVSCFGGSNGSAVATTMNGMAPYVYQWSNGASTAIVNNLMAGTYTLTVTDSKGCPATNSATVSQPTAIQLSFTSTNETAVNANDGTATVTASGGTPGYFYTWETGANTATISGLAPDTYSVTVMDNSGCTSTASVTIQPFSCGGFAPVISSTGITCHGLNDGAASVQLTGGTAPVVYQWSNGQTSPTVNNLPAGNISVTVSDGSGCSATLSTTISEPPVLALTVSHTDETGPGANNGTASAIVTGGTPATGGVYFYNWSNGASTASIQNLAPGSYSVTVSDANGCSSTGQVSIAGFGCFLQISLNSLPATCPDVADGAAEVASISGGSGPFSYLWSNGQTGFQATHLTAGTYSVTVTDGSGCTVTGSVVVGSNDTTQPIALSKNATIYLDGNGMATLNASEVDNGSFDNCSWVNLEVSPASFTCANIGANVVLLKVTDSSGNFSLVTAVVTVIDQLPPVVTCPADLTVQTCSVDYAQPTATDNCGNVTFTLVDGIASGNVFPSGPTEIVWKATDANNNEASCSFRITVQSNLTVSYNVNKPSCHGLNDGSIDLLINGGLPPYQSVWNNGLGPSNLPAGLYAVTVTDAGQCTVGQNIVVGEPDPLEFHLLGGTPASGGQANGTIDFNVIGGTPPYNISWASNGNVIPDFNPAAVLPGTYQAFVIDANGCMISSVPITVDNLNATAAADPGQFCKLFPNPSTGALWVAFDFPTPRLVNLSVVDVTGRPVFTAAEKWIGKQTENIDLQNVTPGVYWVKILVGTEVVWRKVVVI